MSYPLFHAQNQRQPALSLTSAAFVAEFPAEGEYLEFKQGVSERRIQKAVVAFSNADGGVLLIGVSDQGRPVGRELSGDTEAVIHRTVARLVNPGRYTLHELQIDEIPVIVLSVDRRREGVAQMPDGAILARRGASNLPVLGDELTTLLSRRALNRFEMTRTNAAVADADPALIQRLGQAWGWSSGQYSDRLREHRLAIVDEGKAWLTVAGALYLLPQPERELGKAFIEVFRYREGRGEYDKRVEITGPLDRQVADATEVIREELGTDLVVLGVRRYELERVPVTVLREALANAVAHRRYETTNSCVRVELLTDKVVVVSPGGLPEPVTEENIREQNAARNICVIRQLRRLGLAEDAGRGVDHMQDTMQQNLLAAPVFEDSGTHVRVTLPTHSTVTPEERAWVRELESRGELAATDRILLVLAARGEVLTNASARSALGLDSVHARNALQRLRDAGLLAQKGVRAGTRYMLAPDLTPPSGLRLSQRELRDVVLRLAEDGPVTNALVRERTGLDRAQALRLLKSLVSEKRLKQRGERRGSRYVRPQD